MKKWQKTAVVGLLTLGVTGLAQLPKEVSAAGNDYTPAVARNLQGWVNTGQSWKYYQNQRAVTGWLHTGGVWYHFNQYGTMETGWQKISGVWYYFNNKGYMMTGWQKISGVWYYFNSNGNMKTGWQKISGVWYFFNENGNMKTGWLHTGGVWYYFNGNGNMKTGWQKISGVWYYFNNKGYMMTGWQKVGNTWYYFNQNGSMKTGWLKTGGVWYYFNGNGSMKTGWLKQGNKWYYFNNNGAMKTGWLKQGNKWYYFENNGGMKTGALYLGTHYYYFNSNGVMIEDTNYPQNKPNKDKQAQRRREMQAEFDRLLNQYRASRGLPPVKQEQGANWIAQIRADECAKVFGENHPDGSSVDDMVAMAEKNGKLPSNVYQHKTAGAAVYHSLADSSTGKEAAKLYFDYFLKDADIREAFLANFDAYGFSNGSRDYYTGEDTIENGKSMGYELLGTSVATFYVLMRK